MSFLRDDCRCAGGEIAADRDDLQELEACV